MAIKYSMIRTTDQTAMDCTEYETLSGIDVDCSIPDGTDIRFVFKIGNGNWQKYDAAKKQWTDLSGEATTENILSGGSTVDDVKNIDRAAIFPFIGNKVGFAIAASYDDSSEDAPVVNKFGLVDDSVPCGEPVVMNEDAPVEIVDISVSKHETGEGKCMVLASIQDADGAWSRYREYHEYLEKETLAKAVKFRAAYTVKNIGEDSASLDFVTVLYRSSGRKGRTVSVCTTKPFTFPRPIKTVHMVAKHPGAVDVVFQPKVCFRNDRTDSEVWIPMNADTTGIIPETGLVAEEFDYTADEGQAGTIVTLRVDMEGNTGSVTDQALGVGTGAVTTYRIPHNVIRRTISVSPADAVWDYDGKSRSIDITAPAGAPVSLSYDWESETTYLDSISCIFSE